MSGTPLESLRPYLEQLEVCLKSAFDMALRLEEDQRKLEAELGPLKQSLAERDRRLVSLRASLEESKEQRRRLEDQLHQLNEQLRGAREEKESLTRRVTELEEERERLREQIVSLQRQLTEREDRTRSPIGKKRRWITW